MAAKKKGARVKPKAKPEQPKFTAVKLVVHRASDSDETPGMYRYVIAGMLVSSQPLANIPVDNKKSLVLSDVESGDPGLFPAGALHQALGSLDVRENTAQGLSADQNLVSLRRA